MGAARNLPVLDAQCIPLSCAAKQLAALEEALFELKENAAPGVDGAVRFCCTSAIFSARFVRN
jgi:hypothetical protein